MFVTITYSELKKINEGSDEIHFSLQQLNLLDSVMLSLQSAKSSIQNFKFSKSKSDEDEYSQALIKYSNYLNKLRTSKNDNISKTFLVDTFISISQKDTAILAMLIHEINANTSNNILIDSLEQKINDSENKILHASWAFHADEKSRLEAANTNRKRSSTNAVWLLAIVCGLCLLTILCQLMPINSYLKKLNIKERQVAYFSALLEKSTDAIITTDTKGIITAWNKGAEKMFGYLEEEVKGMSVFLATGRQDFIQDQVDLFKESVDKTGFLEREVRQVHRNGQEIYVLANYASFIAEDGSCQGYVGVLKDITKVKIAESLLLKFNHELTEKVNEATKEIKEREEKLRHILTSHPDDFYVVTRDYKISLLNKSAQKNMSAYLGRQVEPGEDVFNLVEADRREVTKANLDKVFSGQSLKYELDRSKPDKKEWVMVSFVPVYNDGKEITGAFVVAEDITERKLAQEEIRLSNERFEMINRTTNDALWEFNIGKGMVWGNEAHQHIYGLAYGGKWPTLQMWVDRIHPEDRELILKQRKDKIDDPNTIIFSAEYRFNIEGKGYRNVYNRCFIKRDEKGQATGMLGSTADVTEIKEAMEGLQQMNNRFEMIGRTTNDAVWEWEVGKGMVWCNEEHQKLYGRTMNDPPPTLDEWIAVIHPDDKDMVIKVKDEIISPHSNKTVFILEYRFLTPKGYRDMYHRCFVVRDKDGNPLKLMGSTMDVTERKQSERDMRRIKNRFELISRTTNDAVWEWDLQDGRLWSNDNHQYLYGLTPNDPVPTEDMWIERIHPDDRARIIALQKEVLDSDKNVFISEYQFRDFSGQYRNVYDRCYVIRDDNGKAIRMMGSMMDVTERKQAEDVILKTNARFQIVSKATSDIVWDWDLLNDTIWWNDNYYENMGYQKKSDLVTSEDWYSYIHPDDMDRVKRNTKSAFESTSNIWRDEYRYKKSDGNFLYFFDRGLIIRDEKGKAIRMIGSMEDVTDRMKTEKELKESYKEVRELTNHLQNIREEERTHMAREIHDELGQQLTVMKMDVSWLAGKLKNTDDVVNNRVKELIQLLDNTVKTVRRISSELRPSLLDDLGLIAAIEWHLKDFERRVAIKTLLTAPEKEISLPDKTKTALFRIFQESLTNVARHAEANKIDVTIENVNGHCILTITDDGKGFDEYKTADKKTLGILGMKERTAMIGGSYEIHSNPGKGTTVKVDVPLVKQNQQTAS
jgi:PAS domain S-box-containing protein